MKVEIRLSFIKEQRTMKKSFWSFSLYKHHPLDTLKKMQHETELLILVQVLSLENYTKIVDGHLGPSGTSVHPCPVEL